MKKTPQTNDRIAVIGGGPAGTHLCYLLNKNGYKNLVLYEKSERLGGKVLSVQRDGVTQELGACYFSQAYKHIIPLLEEIGLNDFCYVNDDFRDVFDGGVIKPSREFVFETMINKYSPSNSNYLLNKSLKVIRNEEGRYLPRVLKVLYGLFAKYNLRNDLIKEIENYLILNDKMMVEGNYDLPYLKDEMNRKILANNMLEHLRGHHLPLLEIIFFILNTSMCYGYPNTCTAYNGTYWMGSELVRSYRDFLQGKRNHLVSSLLKTGFQGAFEKLADLSKATIVYNSHIEKIERLGEKVRIFRDGQVEEFDYLVSAIPGGDMIKLFVQPTKLESRIFGSQIHSIVVTSLTDIVNPYEEMAILYIFKNLRSENKNKVYVMRNSKAILEKQTGRNQSVIAYQFIDRSEDYDEAQVEHAFAKTFDDCDMKIREVALKRVWKYNYRFSKEAIVEGLPWRVEEMQGNSRTWYVGSSVSFESLEAVVNHNHYLVEKFFVA